MRMQRRAVSLLSVAVMALVGIVACSETVTDPGDRMSVEPGLVRGILHLPVLERRVPVTRPLAESRAGEFGGLAAEADETEGAVASRWIGPGGGEIEAADVTLRVPEGAVDRWEWITLEVPSGPYVQAQLHPHGLRFDRALELEFSLEGTTAEGDAIRTSSLLGVYFLGTIEDGYVEVEEVVPTKLLEGSIILLVEHFSGYTPAGG